jgi:hypothetical protein
MTDSDTANIRAFIAEKFSDEDLGTFCYDYFRDIYEQFAVGMSKKEKVQRLIESCVRRGALGSLLAALRKERTTQFDTQFTSHVTQIQPERPARQRDPGQVFISHAHEDSEFAHRLAIDLRAQGWRTWIAPDSIWPGEKWVDAIDRGLQECSVFVVVLTPAAISSKWVITETNGAIDLEHKGRIRFIPSVLKSCELPTLWSAYQSISFQRDYATGLEACIAALKGPAVSASRAEIQGQEGPVDAPEPQAAHERHTRRMQTQKNSAGAAMRGNQPGRHALPEHEYSRRLWMWLEKFRFTEHPFAVWEADRERVALPSLFVDRPYAVRMVGDPARPQSGFLLAGRGAGKTATREMVAYECVHGRLRRRALPIRYTDFTAVLDQAGGDPVRVGLRDHAVAIVRAGLRVLADEVPPAFFDLLDEDQRGLLQGLAASFADPLARMKLGRLTPAVAVQLKWEQFSPVELLDTFAQLVLQMGASERRRYESLYVLVDRVDETAAGAAGALSLLKPLAIEGALLGLPRVAFKFFLPHDIGEQLLTGTAVRRDRLSIESITWDNATLEELLSKRLQYYSNRYVERVTQLCTSAAASIVPRLIRECGASPRNLLRICEGMLRLHIMRTDETFLEPRDISGALIEFEQQLEAERSLSFVGARQAEAAHTGQPPSQGLYLDEGDHVWIDGRQLESSLSDLEFRLLKVLYQAAPTIVTHEQLGAAVGPGTDAVLDDEMYAKYEPNVRKLVGRIRERLEPEAEPGAWRFVRNARGRGYWLSPS